MSLQLTCLRALQYGLDDLMWHKYKNIFYRKYQKYKSGKKIIFFYHKCTIILI